MKTPKKSARRSGGNILYWAIAAVLGGAAATYAYVTSGPPLDKDLSPQEKQAIRFAFTNEKDPRNLRNFARALLPNFRIAAQALAEKAKTLVPVTGTPASPSTTTPAVPGASPSTSLQPLGGGLSTSPLGGATRRISGFRVGDIFDDLGDAVSTVADAASDVGNAIIHPADTVSGAWKIITHPSDSISDFAGALVDALHLIPGMDEAGELLKDFAKTSFGEWCLRILSTYGYFVMAPYLGSGLAAVSFALPGVAKAEPFVESWITETIDRVIKTINILLQQEGLRNIGTATSEAVNKALAENPAVQAMAKTFTEQIGKASDVLTDKLGETIARKLKEGASDALDSVLKKLKAEYGLPPNFSKLAREAGIREDNAAAAYDLLAKTNYQTTTVWDPITGEDIEGNLRRARFQTVDRAGQTAVTQVYQDPRLLTLQQTMTRRAVAVSNLLNPPARQKWVEFYLNRERYAKAGAKAPSASAPMFGFDPTIQSPLVPLQPGGYMVEFESQSPGGAGIPELFRYNGVQATGMRQIGPNRYRIFIRTPHLFQLRNLPGLRWVISRKLSL